MGINPQATYHGGDFDFVDMSTGRLNLHIPLVVDHSQRGKLNFTYSLTYSSTGNWPITYSSRGNQVRPPKYGVSSPVPVTDGSLGAISAITYHNDSGGTDHEFFVAEEGYGIGPNHPYAMSNFKGVTIDGSGLLLTIILSLTRKGFSSLRTHPLLIRMEMRWALVPLEAARISSRPLIRSGELGRHLELAPT